MRYPKFPKRKIKFSILYFQNARVHISKFSNCQVSCFQMSNFQISDLPMFKFSNFRIPKIQKSGAWTFQHFQKNHILRYEKLFSQGCPHNFLAYFKLFLVINTRSEGPYLDTFLVVPNMFQKYCNMSGSKN